MPLIRNAFARLTCPATRDWFRAFTACSFSTCRPLRPLGPRLPSMPKAMADDTGLRRFRPGSALPMRPPSVSGGPLISGLLWFTLSLRPVNLLASSTDPTGFPQPRRHLLSGFQRVGHPSRRRVSLRWHLGILHRRDLHPLEQQLASLHPEGEGFTDPLAVTLNQPSLTLLIYCNVPISDLCKIAQDRAMFIYKAIDTRLIVVKVFRINSMLFIKL